MHTLYYIYTRHKTLSECAERARSRVQSTEQIAEKGVKTCQSELSDATYNSSYTLTVTSAISVEKMN